MKLKNVYLKNFRNYSESDVELGSRLTVIIGNNGNGKTNLISAIVKSLSFIFAPIELPIRDFFLDSLKYYSPDFEVTDARNAKSMDYDTDYHYPVIVRANASLSGGKKIEWTFRKEKESVPMTLNGYSKACESFWESFATYREKGDAPCFFYFSDSYPNALCLISDDFHKKINSGFALPRNMAYDHWADEFASAESWERYYVMQKKNAIFKGDANAMRYVEMVEKAFVNFTKPLVRGVNTEFSIKSVTIDATENGETMIFRFKNGEDIRMTHLPQGYKRVFSMLLSMVSRMSLLNDSYDGSGIAIIDEIELHLHPSLAQEILPRLMRTFKHVQFVVTTHSPLVLSNIEPGDRTILYGIGKDKNHSPVLIPIHEFLFGEDASYIIEAVMGTDARSSKVQLVINDLAKSIKVHDFEKGHQVLNKLHTLLDKNHRAMIKYETIMRRMELIGK